MSRKIEVALLTAALAIAAPFAAAEAASTRHPAEKTQPLVVRSIEAASPTTDGGLLAANTAAALQRFEAGQRASDTGHGGSAD